MTYFIRAIFLCFFTLSISPFVFGQVGGESGFNFLKIPETARISALAGVNVSSQGEDVNMFLANPALLNADVHRHISVNYLDYLADIQYSSLTYAHERGKGTWAVGLQYLDYGSFEGFDEAGNASAAFNARDFAITVGHARTIGVFSLGMNLKLAQSYIGSYTATGILADIGGIYADADKALTVGLVIKNFGVVFGDYTENSNTRPPFDVQLGTTFKPEHMPFRFSLTAYNLAQGDVTYYDPSLRNNKGELGFVDKVFRHLTLGAEVLLSENFNLRVGYNHLMRKELRLDETSGGAGFSAGFMLRIKAFEIAYSRRFYHVAGGANSFTLASDLNTFIKKN